MTSDALFHGYLSMQARGVLALPPEVRRRWHLDRPGAQVELVERPDGVLELRPQLPVPARQDWFWAPEWQSREREADADLREGRFSEHDSAESMLESLDG